MDSESLAAPRLDQGAAQELIHQPLRLEAARGAQEAPRVRARSLASEADAPLGEDLQDRTKVLELFRGKS
jgi:hypothetical protein